MKNRTAEHVPYSRQAASVVAAERDRSEAGSHPGGPHGWHQAGVVRSPAKLARRGARRGHRHGQDGKKIGTAAAAAQRVARRQGSACRQRQTAWPAVGAVIAPAQGRGAGAGGGARREQRARGTPHGRRGAVGYHASVSGWRRSRGGKFRFGVAQGRRLQRWALTGHGKRGGGQKQGLH